MAPRLADALADADEGVQWAAAGAAGEPSTPETSAGAAAPSCDAEVDSDSGENDSPLARVFRTLTALGDEEASWRLLEGVAALAARSRGGHIPMLLLHAPLPGPASLVLATSPAARSQEEEEEASFSDSDPPAWEPPGSVLFPPPSDLGKGKGGCRGGAVDCSGWRGRLALASQLACIASESTGAAMIKSHSLRVPAHPASDLLMAALESLLADPVLAVRDEAAAQLGLIAARAEAGAGAEAGVERGEKEKGGIKRYLGLLWGAAFSPWRRAGGSALLPSEKQATPASSWLASAPAVVSFSSSSSSSSSTSTSTSSGCRGSHHVQADLSSGLLDPTSPLPPVAPPGPSCPPLCPCRRGLALLPELALERVRSLAASPSFREREVRAQGASGKARQSLRPGMGVIERRPTGHSPTLQL